MAAVGTNSAELRAIKKIRPKLVTAISKQGGLAWFSQKLQEFDFLTSERAFGIVSKLGVSDEDKVSSLLEAAESKIKSNQRGTATKAVRRPGNEARGTPFTDFVEMLESEGCLQDMGQTLQYECQMFKEQAVISGQIATSMSEAKPSLSTRSRSADPNGGVACISSSTTPTPFPMQRVGGSILALPLPEENENTVESSTDVADGEEIDLLCAKLPIGHQQVDVTAPSSMVPVQQTSTQTRAKDLQDHVGAELSAIGGDVAKKASQLKGQLQEQLQQKDQLEQRVEDQEKQITAITEEKKKLETEVQKKTEELTQTNEQLAEKACKLEECEHDLSLEVEQLQQQLAQKTAELESSREQLADREKEVDEVRRETEKEIAEIHKALEEKAKALEAREERETELRKANQQEITDLKLELEKKENELLKTQLELARKDAPTINVQTETGLQAQPTSNLQAQDPTMELQSHGATALPSTSHVGDNVPRPAASLAQPQLEASLPILHEQAVPRLPVEKLTGLHGVDIITETSISVTDKPQTFHWAGYGLKLHIPPASLPAGVGQSDIVIKASLAGQFRFPENTALVSAVYWLRCPVKFTKPLTLEIQHCGKHSGTLSFVRAKCSLPYLFKPLASPRGVFSSQCGTVTLFSFSGLGIVQEGSEEQQYCARLYYIGSRIDWRVYFVVMKDLEAFITVIHQNYTEKGAIEGPDQDIEFEEDRITMEIPEIDGWTVIALTPAMIIKKKVDSYKGGRRIPSCQLQVKLNKDQPADDFHKKVILRGAKKPLNYITIQSDPLPSGKSSSPIHHVRDNILLNESHHSEITDYLVSIESEKKQLIDLGKKLGLRYSRLKRMTDSDNFLDDVIMSWLRKEDDVNEKCPPNWKNLVRVLTEIKQTGIATRIEFDKSLQ